MTEVDFSVYVYFTEAFRRQRNTSSLQELVNGRTEVWTQDSAGVFFLQHLTALNIQGLLTCYQKKGDGPLWLLFPHPKWWSHKQPSLDHLHTSLILCALLLFYCLKCFLLPDPGSGNYRGNQLTVNKSGSECQQKAQEGTSLVLSGQRLCLPSRGPKVQFWSGN